MKLASLDDLLAEIGLGNAMSVVVAKICNRMSQTLRLPALLPPVARAVSSPLRVLTGY